MQAMPVQMHPKYKDFLAFVDVCPYRKTPSVLELGFWVWMNSGGESSAMLKRDLNTLHRQKAARDREVILLADEVDRLKTENELLKKALSEVRDES